MWKYAGPGSFVRSALAAVSVAAMLATPALAADDATPSDGAELTIFDGVYTEEQAERGKALYATDCTACHGNTARGGPGSPGLVAFTLDSKYADQPLSAYWNFMVHNMPPGNAGWFTDQEYADITAYLLQLHGAPSGDTELEGTEEALSQIMIVPTP